MSDQAIQDAARRLRNAPDDQARLEIFVRSASELDRGRADEYEVAATALAVACKSFEEIADFALRAFSNGLQAGEEAKFLIFAAGAIACRRAQDRSRGDKLFELARKDFVDLPLFKHFVALALDGGKQPELRRGLRLEREFLADAAPHAGASHLLTRFILQLRECGDRSVDRETLEEALDSVDEAIELRPGYAKFFATRAAVHRQLGQFREARNDLLDAIRLEDRSSVDARERIGDYKRELAVIDVFRSLGTVEEKVTGLEARSESTVERLRNAELSVITAVGFLAAALALVQVTVTNVTDRSVGASIAIIAAFGVVLFGAVAVGSWLLRRPWRSLERDPGAADYGDG